MKQRQPLNEQVIKVEKNEAAILTTAASLMNTTPERLLHRCIKLLLNKRPPALCDRSENKTSSSP